MRYAEYAKKYTLIRDNSELLGVVMLHQASVQLVAVIILGQWPLVLIVAKLNAMLWMQKIAR